MQESQVSTHPAAHWVAVDHGGRTRLEMRWTPPTSVPAAAPLPTPRATAPTTAASTVQPAAVTHAA